VPAEKGLAFPRGRRTQKNAGTSDITVTSLEVGSSYLPFLSHSYPPFFLVLPIKTLPFALIFYAPNSTYLFCQELGRHTLRSSPFTFYLILRAKLKGNLNLFDRE
jgi:hypothetical protein